jgi:hypothetical protein
VIVDDDWGLGAPPPAGNQCLPSGDAAIGFTHAPSWSNFGQVLGTFAVRGALAGTGIYLAGARGKDLWLYTAAATAAIEVGVLVWAATK